jgi:hypothetical protein
VNQRAGDDERRARELYALTDQLQVQLRVLEETPASVDVRIASTDSADVDALAYVVMMQASRSAQEDLRAVMDQVKAINAAKKRWRDRARPQVADEVDLDAVFQLVTTLYVKQVQAELNRQLDDMSEMGELESLRLQMALDRLAKLMSTLSNVMKKVSDTTSQITQNLK